MPFSELPHPWMPLPTPPGRAVARHELSATYVALGALAYAMDCHIDDPRPQGWLLFWKGRADGRAFSPGHLGTWAPGHFLRMFTGNWTGTYLEYYTFDSRPP